jgi:hypothetical protein
MSERLKRELFEILERNRPTLRPITLENCAAVFIMNYFLINTEAAKTSSELEEVFKLTGIDKKNISPTLSGLGAWHLVDFEDGRWCLSKAAETKGFKLEQLNDFTHHETNAEWRTHLKMYGLKPIDTQVDEILKKAIELAMACDRTKEEIIEIINQGEKA